MFDGWDAGLPGCPRTACDAAHQTQVPDRLRAGRRRGAGLGATRPHGAGTGRRPVPARPPDGKPTARPGRTRRSATADYWSFADWLAPYFDQLWDPDRALLPLRQRSVGPHLPQQRLLLTTHAIAALVGHEGDVPPGRPRARARAPPLRLAALERARRSPIEPRPAVPHARAGWRAWARPTRRWTSRSTRRSPRRSCTRGGRATCCGCRARRVDLIDDRIARCARGPFFRFPNVRLNQINWHSEMYAHFATVTGDTELLVNDYRAAGGALRDGITQRRRAAAARPTSGPATASTTCRTSRRRTAFNLDSAEYANMTCHFLIWYEQALRAGMVPLAPGARAAAARLGRAHRLRLLDARRLPELGHRLQLQALARRPDLRARAAGPVRDRALPRFHARPEIGDWAKYMLDAGLALYERLSRDGGRTARASPRRSSTTSTSRRSGRACASCSPRACRPMPRAPSCSGWAACRRPAAAALLLRPRHRQARGHDPALLDRGPAGEPARVPVRRHRAGRLYDRDQRVVSNIGGRPWASFGVVVRQPARRSRRPSGRRRAAAAPATARCCRPRGVASTCAAVPAAALRGPVRDPRRAGPHRVR